MILIASRNVKPAWNCRRYVDSGSRGRVNIFLCVIAEGASPGCLMSQGNHSALPAAKPDRTIYPDGPAENPPASTPPPNEPADSTVHRIRLPVFPILNTADLHSTNSCSKSCPTAAPAMARAQCQGSVLSRDSRAEVGRRRRG